MSFENKENPIQDLPDLIKDSYNSKIDLLSLFMVKKLIKIVPAIILGSILVFIFFFLTLFLSHSFIAWYEDYVGKGSTAALIVSGFYLLLGLIAYFFRKQIIYRPIQKAFTADLDFSEIHTTTGIGKVSSIEELDIALENSREASKEVDRELGNTIDDIKDFYSFDSIKSRFFTNILENPKPIIATALQAFMSFQSFKSRRKSRK